MAEITQCIGQYVEKRKDIPNPNALRPFKDVQIDLLGDVWAGYESMFAHKTKQNDGDGNDDDDDDEDMSEEKSNLFKEKQEDIDMKMAEKTEPKTIDIKSIHCPYKEFSRLKKKFP